jgi:5-methylcytosine-specific restriction protein B
MVTGTLGLHPDEAILGKPGHARKLQALAAWINSQYGQGSVLAWSKSDPTRTDQPLPPTVRALWPEYSSVYDRYGKEIYFLFRPTDDRTLTETVLAALLDIYVEERNGLLLKGASQHATQIRTQWMAHLLPTLSRSDVVDTLQRQRYAIIQGPPGTGKTRLAQQLLAAEYAGNGFSIQFHPSTSYETFVGGLFPQPAASGISFVPQPGHLMRAAAAAQANPQRPYLLHIDEINRADLSKVLGEALFLLEPNADLKRSVDLAYDFGEPFHRQLSLPPNLHILGTMNTSDRSIALVDVAVRRRFAFLTLWPDSKVIAEHGCAYTLNVYQQLLHLFTEHAPEEAFALLPGHSYFLIQDEQQARRELRHTLVPLLDEYLAQGFVAGFAEQVRSITQWLRAA